MNIDNKFWLAVLVLGFFSLGHAQKTEEQEEVHCQYKKPAETIGYPRLNVVENFFHRLSNGQRDPDKQDNQNGSRIEYRSIDVEEFLIFYIL